MFYTVFTSPNLTIFFSSFLVKREKAQNGNPCMTKYAFQNIFFPPSHSYFLWHIICITKAKSNVACSAITTFLLFFEICPKKYISTIFEHYLTSVCPYIKDYVNSLTNNRSESLLWKAEEIELQQTFKFHECLLV